MPEHTLDPPARHAPAPAGNPQHPLRALMMRLHFYAGVLVGPFILIAAVTGGLYAVAPTAEKFIYHDLLTVEPGQTALSLTQQTAVAHTAFPGLALSGVRPALGAADSTRVYFSDPALGADFQRAVFVDPYTGRILGDQPTWFGYLPMSTWLDGLHRQLQLGEPGRVYSELAASWLWVVALGGLYLWLVRPAASRLARRRSPRQRSLRLHGRVGIWVLLMLLFLSATGITWSTYAGAHVSDIRTALHWQRPALGTATTVHHDGHGHMPPAAGTTDLDRVVATADAAGVHAPVELTLPADGGEPVSVTEIDAPFRLTTNAAAVDTHTSTVVGAIDYWRDYSVVAMLADWGIRLHMGFLFGLANQLLLLGVAVATVVLIVVGYRMWWQRRPTRGARWRAGRTPRRGVLRPLSLPAVAGVAAGALAIGWFLPLLGLSLLGFLLVDAGVGMLQRRRATQLG
jgi:uncharacterized iron-regulated membrane protein